MTPSKTLTGEYPIGFRRGGGWQNDIDTLATWASQNGFGCVDLGMKGADADLAVLAKAGLQAGSVDLQDWNGFQALIAKDSSERKDLIAATVAHIEACAAAGASIFFTPTVPLAKELPRKENFDYMIEAYSALIPALEKTGSRVVLEGWPGPSALVCTPETYRAFFKEIKSDRFGVNYDPSHLLRMGIDPLRFLKEFVGQVYHVHGKDTALYADDLYEYGHEQPATFQKGHGWGGWAWRYTIPGHGESRWVEIFRLLKEAGYKGLVSIELEDENFNGTEAGEQRGFIKSREFLEGC